MTRRAGAALLALALLAACSHRPGDGAVKRDAPALPAVAEAAAPEPKAQDTPEASERARRIRELRPSWPEETVRAVARGQLVIGMDKEQVLLVLGRGPYKMYRIPGEEGEKTMEVWLTDWAYYTRRLVFVDGALAQIIQQGAPAAPDR